jgi:hypothetical protein
LPDYTTLVREIILLQTITWTSQNQTGRDLC